MAVDYSHLTRMTFLHTCRVQLLDISLQNAITTLTRPVGLSLAKTETIVQIVLTVMVRMIQQFLRNAVDWTVLFIEVFKYVFFITEALHTVVTPKWQWLQNSTRNIWPNKPPRYLHIPRKRNIRTKLSNHDSWIFTDAPDVDHNVSLVCGPRIILFSIKQKILTFWCRTL